MPGKPEHVPTAKTRKEVMTLAGIGVPQIDICHILDISKPTLHKHYRLELDRGQAEANAKIAQTLYMQAIGGNIAALIFWTKSRMGWREKHEVDINHQHSFVIRAPYPSETEEQWLKDYTPKEIAQN